MLRAISNTLTTFERYGAIFCVALVTILIGLNVVTRALNQALFWVDEIAIYAMVWMLFLTTAFLLKRRQAVAVTIVVDLAPTAVNKVINKIVDVVVLLFSILLIVFSFYWYQPFDLFLAGFDFDKFSSNTFNFIYTERGNTIPINKFWIWIIMPYFALSVFIHSLVNLLYSDSTQETTS